MGAGARLIADYYARIVLEAPMLRPTPEQRRALYTIWPVESCAGQRLFRVREGCGKVLDHAGELSGKTDLTTT